MPGAPTILCKGSLIHAIDERLKAPKPEYLEELEQGKPLLAIGVASGVVNTPKIENHVRAEAFGTWWPDVYLKQDIIRAGYIHALRVALAPLRHQPPDPPKPIVTYWMTGVKNFEFVVAESPQQVSVFWLTPDPPWRIPPGPPEDVQEDIWLIAPEPRIAEVRARFPASYGLEDPIGLVAGVQGQRVKGY